MTFHRKSGAERDQGMLFQEPIRPASLQTAVGIERGFDVPFVSELALKEKQIQQNVRPVIAVHKWFARRPGTLFRALLLSEFGGPPLRESYFQPHRLNGLRVADPFMGGGTPLLEANRLGCDVFGWDINPMAYWVVRQEISHLDLVLYKEAAVKIGKDLRDKVGHLYRTRCRFCGEEGAEVKYFIWVKTCQCDHCAHEVTLFPGYLLARTGRHPRNVVICHKCGELSEVVDLDKPGHCADCGNLLRVEGPAKRNRCICSACGEEVKYPQSSSGPPSHRMVAIEYHCGTCRPNHQGRYFKRPDVLDLERFSCAEKKLEKLKLGVVPADSIPDGDETARLHRWGYQQYQQLFNARQLLALEILGRCVKAVKALRVREALATNFSDLLRYQNMVCRYDTQALKSLDIFSVHGFPVGLIQCESNFLGIQYPVSRQNIGSGGWSNIVDKFIKAKEYCKQPFELRYEGGKKQIVSIPEEWIGDHRDGSTGKQRLVRLNAGSATRACLPPETLDAVLTDPPYFANVQYAELMDFCYVWLRRLVNGEKAFRRATTRNPDELTGNDTLCRDLIHFTEGLGEVFSRLAKALKAHRPFVFTYHHNSIEAYFPVAVALLDAGLTCTMSLPCPAEMSGSIHIFKTESSIVDTVFVCRKTGRIRKRWLADNERGIAELVSHDIEQLRQGSVRVTKGDARCVAFGHLIRMAVWNLRKGWRAKDATRKKLDHIADAVAEVGNWEGVQRYLGNGILATSRKTEKVREAEELYDTGADDEISF